MATRNLHAVHALNSYLWYRIGPTGENLLKTIPYKASTTAATVQLRPIVPIEETPQLITAIEAQPGMGSVPFIVYNWTKIDNGQMWFLQLHEVAYSIRSGNDTVMRQIINLFDEEFRSYDEAAQKVNEYLRTGPGVTASLKDYEFKYIHISTLGGQMPTDTEDGMRESLITIRIGFVGP